MNGKLARIQEQERLLMLKMTVSKNETIIEDHIVKTIQANEEDEEERKKRKQEKKERKRREREMQSSILEKEDQTNDNIEHDFVSNNDTGAKKLKTKS